MKIKITKNWFDLYAYGPSFPYSISRKAVESDGLTFWINHIKMKTWCPADFEEKFVKWYDPKIERKTIDIVTEISISPRIRDNTFGLFFPHIIGDKTTILDFVQTCKAPYSVKIFNCLCGKKLIENLDDLSKLTLKETLQIKDFGRKSFDTLIEILEASAKRA